MMDKLHDKVVGQFNYQLGTGLKLSDIIHNTDTSSILVLDKNGVKLEAVIPKVVLSDRINGVATVHVEANATYEDVYRTVSDHYDLFWVPGVDYPTDKTVVGYLEGTFSTLITFTVPDTSYLWTGTLNIEVIDNTNGNIPPLEVPIDPMRVNAALSSNIFSDDGELFTADKKSISVKFSKRIVTYLKEVDFTGLSPADIGNGELIQAVVDGFSGIAVVRPKKGPILFIRYRLKR